MQNVRPVKRFRREILPKIKKFASRHKRPAMTNSRSYQPASFRFSAHDRANNSHHQSHSHPRKRCAKEISNHPKHLLSFSYTSNPDTSYSKYTSNSLRPSSLSPLFHTQQKSHPASHKAASFLSILAMTYLPSKRPASIVGAQGLNFCVRDGYRCVPFAIVTRIFHLSSLLAPSKLHSNFCSSNFAASFHLPSG